MKKIMFNDKYGLTQAVLEGRKTMTRRIIQADVAEASDLNYKMQLALYDKLGNTLWDNKKYLYLMNCIYGLSDSKNYEIKK